MKSVKKETISILVYMNADIFFENHVASGTRSIGEEGIREICSTIESACENLHVTILKMQVKYDPLDAFNYSNKDGTIPVKFFIELEHPKNIDIRDIERTISKALQLISIGHPHILEFWTMVVQKPTKTQQVERSEIDVSNFVTKRNDKKR